MDQTPVGIRLDATAIVFQPMSHEHLVYFSGSGGHAPNLGVDNIPCAAATGRVLAMVDPERLCTFAVATKRVVTD